MKYHVLLFIIQVFLLSPNIAVGQCSLDKTNWSLVFEDNFNGTTSDLSNNWHFEYTHGRVLNPGESDEFTYMDPSNLSVSNGYLYIKHKREIPAINYNGFSYDYSSGLIRSKIDDVPSCDGGSNGPGGMLYGMYEVRCKVQKSSNLKSSAWLTSNNDWPPEIDLFEYKTENKKSFFSTVHWLPGGSGNACQNFYEYPYDIGDDFHTWTVVWTPEEVSWFFDGVLLKTDDRAAHIPGTTRPNEWELCRWDKMDLILNGRVTSPTSSFDDLIVDYVKFYKPQSLSPFTGSNGVQFTTYYNNHLVPTYLSLIHISEPTRPY